MSKVSLVDRTIAQLQGEIEVLQMAIQKLKAQQTMRRPRAVATKEEQSAVPQGAAALRR